MKIQKVVLILLFILSIFNVPDSLADSVRDIKKEAVQVLRHEILARADLALKLEPQTITMFECLRSAGDKHDFYSEGDYWWPDPNNTGGPFIQREGMTNPDNFVAHRLTMIRFSQIIGTLASAYKITGDEK